MTTILRLIGFVALLAIVLAGGVVHGLMTDRWNLKEESPLAKRLAVFPKSAGDWELQEEEEISDYALKTLECEGYLARAYRNKQTGETVKVAVLLGPAGPIAVHTPEICYSSREFEIEKDRVAASIGDEDRFWKLTLNSKDIHAQTLRVYYGWTTDGNWKADNNPRFNFAGEPYLVKLQIATRISKADKEATSDPCVRFLSDFTPQLRKHLFSDSSDG